MKTCATDAKRPRCIYNQELFIVWGGIILANNTNQNTILVYCLSSVWMIVQVFRARRIKR